MEFIAEIRRSHLMSGESSVVPEYAYSVTGHYSMLNDSEDELRCFEKLKVVGSHQISIILLTASREGFDLN